MWNVLKYFSCVFTQLPEVFVLSRVNGVHGELGGILLL